MWKTVFTLRDNQHFVFHRRYQQRNVYSVDAADDMQQQQQHQQQQQTRRVLLEQCPWWLHSSFQSSILSLAHLRACVHASGWRQNWVWSQTINEFFRLWTRHTRKPLHQFPSPAAAAAAVAAALWAHLNKCECAQLGSACNRRFKVFPTTLGFAVVVLTPKEESRAVN